MERLAKQQGKNRSVSNSMSSIHLIYLQHIGSESGSRSAVEEAVNAASWAHQIAGLDGIGQSPVIKTVMAGLQRSLAKPKVKKEPITLCMLKQMADIAGQPPSLADSRLLAISLLAFSVLLRFDEIVKIVTYALKRITS